MRNITLSLLTLILVSCSNDDNVSTTNYLELLTIEDSVSYIIGNSRAKEFEQGFAEVNLEAYILGIKDMQDTTKSLLIDEQKGSEIVQTYFTNKQAAQQEQAQSEMAPKIKEGEEFLAKNRTREGVTTTASGLQYEIITQGTGAKPGLTDQVETHYHGTFLDGTVFDSSVDRGEPTSFPVNQVIAGWTEALQLMSVGSKWKLYVPYNLAYGERGEPRGGIDPYSTLIFEVELLGIK